MSSDTPCLVRVSCRSGLNVRAGAGARYSLMGLAPFGYIYTITEKKQAGGQVWGKLKGGGWICMTGYTEPIR
ncbi:MAG: hypothetical protein IJ561_07765 [Ruminococcus sp.]|nr:hypothetical protein [Ruminococcus sp.]